MRRGFCIKTVLHKNYGLSGPPLRLLDFRIFSFIESSICPLPPDPLYNTMLLKQRVKAWTLALWCTATSVAGGWLGYAIGSVLYESLGQRILRAYGMTETFGHFKQQFHVYGFWIVAAKGVDASFLQSRYHLLWFNRHDYLAVYPCLPCGSRILISFFSFWQRFYYAMARRFKV